MARAMGKPSTANKPIRSMTTAVEGERQTFLCYGCGKEKARSDFYTSMDPFNVLGVTTYCKDCLIKIARNYNQKTKMYGDVTKASVLDACERADFPFLEDVWEASVRELNKTDAKNKKTNAWAAYAKNIKMQQYATLRYRDSDFFKSGAANIIIDDITKPPSQEVLDECEKNKKDVIRLIGYDPFDKEADEDKPLLYAQLIGYIDAEGNNDDMTRVLDSIEIVRGYLQLQKINDMSAKAFSNLAKTGNAGEIKNYMDTKKKVADVISQLAEQSCISLKHNKNAKKGENTWTGKIKKLKELNLREGEVNGFDMGTCRGMQQVLEMSDASIMRQLRLDESEWSDMVAEQREKLIKLQSERDVYKEINRILLRENIDLRDILNENNMLDESNLQDLKNLFSAFSDIEETEDVSEEVVEDGEEQS